MCLLLSTLSPSESGSKPAFFTMALPALGAKPDTENILKKYLNEDDQEILKFEAEG